jgi:perosamine synthetase
MISIYRPFLNEETARYAYDAISSGWVSSKGEYVERATEELKKAYGFKYVLLTNSGTSAGHLVARALKRACSTIRFIVAPNNAYVASYNTVDQECENEELVCVDADVSTWLAQYGVSYGEHDAILVVHSVSGVINVPVLKRRCPRIPIIEDACEGFSGTYDGKPVGTESLAASISFYANKTLTSGEGGAFVTSDPDLYADAWCTANQGVTGEFYIHDRPGWNYRITNVQAALLYGQLLHREEIVARKKCVFDLYRQMLPTERVLLQETEEGTTSSNWMMACRIVGSPSWKQAASFLARYEIESRPMFPPITAHAHLKHVPCASTKVADLLHRECVMLPSYPEMTEGEVMQVVEAVHAYARSLR